VALTPLSLHHFKFVWIAPKFISRVCNDFTKYRWIVGTFLQLFVHDVRLSFHRHYKWLLSNTRVSIKSAKPTWNHRTRTSLLKSQNSRAESFERRTLERSWTMDSGFCRFRIIILVAKRLKTVKQQLPS